MSANLADAESAGRGGARRALCEQARSGDALARSRAEAALCAEATSQGGTLCPACLALVPIDPTGRTPGWTLSGGRLAIDRSVLDLAEERPGPAAAARSADRAGAALIASSLAAALFAPSPFWPAAVLAGAGWLALGYAAGRRWAEGPREDRAIDLAWERWAPLWLERAGERGVAGRLAALCRASVDRGTPARRESALAHLLQAAADPDPDAAPPPFAAAAYRLSIADRATTGVDPVSLLAEVLGLCLDGTHPAELGDELLDEPPEPATTPGGRERLRVLVAARAFALGWGVPEFRDLAGRVAWFGGLFPESESERLARWRCLYGLVPSRPWAAFGAVTHLFELAHFPATGGELLARNRDLLWTVPMGGPDSRDFTLTANGPASRGKRLDTADAPTPAWARAVERAERWRAREFLPLVEREAGDRPADSRAAPRRRPAVACPSCGQLSRPRRGMRAEPVVAVVRGG